MNKTQAITYKLGQVGGFPLRLSWLPRLVVASTDKLPGKAPFGDPETIALEMGIGMNMVKSLRIWAQAAGIIGEGGLLEMRAHRLFSKKDGVDKYAEKEDTLWLLHWLICSNPRCFTANSWLLNFFHARVFTLAEALDAFSTHLHDIQKRPYSPGTTRVDLETAIRMYASDDGRRSDTDDRRFSTMRLMLTTRKGRETHYTRILRDERPRLNSKVVMYSVIDALSKRGVSASSFSDLYVADNMSAPGSVFGLTKDGFLSALEAAAYDHPLSLKSMPDGDFQVRLTGKCADRAERGDETTADDFYFPRKQ